MRELTVAQRATIGDIQKMKLRGLVFLGVDFDGNPVIWIHDKRRKFPMAVKPDGSGRPPRLPVHLPDERDIFSLPFDDLELILSMTHQEPKGEYLGEVWLPATVNVEPSSVNWEGGAPFKYPNKP